MPTSCGNRLPLSRLQVWHAVTTLDQACEELRRFCELAYGEKLPRPAQPAAGLEHVYRDRSTPGGLLTG